VGDAATNRAAVDEFWTALYARDWDAIAACFTEDATYTDVPSPEDDLAVGPAQIVARLRLGIEPITEYEHHPKLAVADEHAVITEHAEEWHWKTGESVILPFTSVHEMEGGKIKRWYDYWDMQTLMNAAPQWWIEHIMQGYQ
jgi:limonene-1,2-epoxide hydrolase